MKKIAGLNVDAEKIGAGLYKIICDKGEEAIVAFGMIPSWAVDSMRPMLREKVISEAGKTYGCSAHELELMGVVDEAKIAKIVQRIEHEVVLGIYAAAKSANAMVV